ncbi:hypothetical protein SOHN41_03843 [Shewanella sp. HN-41]|nr:hypothetical protein SOHN41_03843 [Shewanella sp. HN-41]
MINKILANTEGHAVNVLVFALFNMVACWGKTKKWYNEITHCNHFNALVLTTLR